MHTNPPNPSRLRRAAMYLCHVSSRTCTVLYLVHLLHGWYHNAEGKHQKPLVTLVQLSRGRIADTMDSFMSTSKEGIPLSTSAYKGVNGLKFGQRGINALKLILCGLVLVLQLSHQLHFDFSSDDVHTALTFEFMRPAVRSATVKCSLAFASLCTYTHSLDAVRPSVNLVTVCWMAM